MDLRLILGLFSLLYFFLCQLVFSAPVLESNGAGKDEELKLKEKQMNASEKKIEGEIDDLGLEYGRYLQQIVEALEEDKDFAKKLENVSQEEIKNGAIARELNFVSHNVRNKLDELKRIEMTRLRQLARKEHDLEMRQEAGVGGGEDESGRRWRTVDSSKDNLKTNTIIDAQHVDHQNPHSFEAEDLQKLILTATKDLEELDAKRREDFKQYEMEKELRYQDSLANMTQAQKEETQRKHDELQQKHKQHPRVHHPGSKQQLEQVWEEQDHMPREEFNPKVFFTMHDINGDGFLDAEEVEAILSVEVRKMYSEKNPSDEDDPNEMREEYHRMREHIYKEADVNRDGLISKKEFLDFTRRMEFEKDDEWKGLDQQQVYNQQELERYRQERSRQQQQHEQQYGAYQQFQPQYYPQGYQYDPNQQYYAQVDPRLQQHLSQQQLHQQQQQQQQHVLQQQQQQQYYAQQQQHAPQMQLQGQPPQHVMAAQQQQHVPQIPQQQQQFVPLQQPNPQLHEQQMPPQHQIPLHEQQIPLQQQQQQHVPQMGLQQQPQQPQHVQQQQQAQLQQPALQHQPAAQGAQQHVSAESVGVGQGVGGRVH